MKKALSLILASLMVLSLAACGTKAETPAPAPSDPAPAEQSGETADYPTKTIEIACPNGAGGARTSGPASPPTT